MKSLSLHGKRIWLSGHTGFKGGILAHWLLKHGAVVSGYALAPDTDPALFDVLKLGARMAGTIADIRDASRVRAHMAEFGPEIVLHLAAQPLVRASYEDPLGTIATNVQGTANVLDAARFTPSVHSVVVVTTDKCYENRGPRQPFRESDRLGGDDPYSASKAAAELVVATYRKSFFPKPGSARIASARAGNVIGGGDWSRDRLLPDCIRALETTGEIVLRNPGASRPWQHVLDPLRGYVMLAARLPGADGQDFAGAWNFGPTEPEWSVEEVASLAIRQWRGGRLTIRPAQDGFHEAFHLQLDSSRARDLLGWTPVWNTEEAVRRTVDWHRAFRDGADMLAFTSREIDDYEAACG